MEFFFIFTLWWLELHTITAMVDFQTSIEGWLEDATLFPAEHNDFLNIDDPLNSLKTNNDGVPDELSGLQWLEEPSVTDALITEFFKSYPDFHLFDPEGLISLSDDMKTDIPETNSGTPSFLKSNPDFLQYDSEGMISPSDDVKTEINSIPETNSGAPSFLKSYPDYLQFGLEVLISPSDDMKTEINSLPETNSSTPSSPVSKSVPLSPSSFYESISEASSPASFISLDSGLDLSPTSPSDGRCVDSPPVVSVTICENAEIGSEPPLPMTIEEVVNSVKEKKYLTGRGEVPKVKVSLKNTFHPYSKTKSGSRRKRSSDPDERKKVQNKEAAARYRIKKRLEEKEIEDRVNSEEKKQRELQSKHDDILSEIKYLKSLMCEMLQKKGLMEA